MGGAEIRVRELEVAYRGRPVLHGVSFAVGAGEFVAVLGPSGTGKSTLLRVLAGLLPPERGAVELVAPDGTPARAGVVFQEPRLLPWLRTADNVALALSGTREERRRRAEEALAAVGLRGWGGAWPRELSGGMAQRAALARALVLRPQALLLDEPFSAVDALTRMQLQDHLLRLWAELRFTVVLVTHDVDEAAYLADRVLVLGGAPASVRAEVAVDLPRPRDRSDPALAEVRGRLLRALAELLPPARRPEEAWAPA